HRARHPALPGLPGQVVQQQGLARTRVAAYHQGPALTGPDGLDQPVQRAALAAPVDHPVDRSRLESAVIGPALRRVPARPGTAPLPWPDRNLPGRTGKPSPRSPVVGAAVPHRAGLAARTVMTRAGTCLPSPSPGSGPGNLLDRNSRANCLMSVPAGRPP